MDSANESCIDLPICAPKVRTRKYLQEKCESHPGVYVDGYIANGLFLDWGIQSGILVEPGTAEHSATFYSGGDVPFSAANLADVAKAVWRIIQHQEQTANLLRSYIVIRNDGVPHDEQSRRIYTSHFTCIHTYSQH